MPMTENSSMIAATLPGGAELGAVRAGPARVPRKALASEGPLRSTRALEAAFARDQGRWPLVGLILSAMVSAGMWAAIVAIAF
jgi:hypothetical protein